jgi:hypothetical protein
MMAIWVEVMPTKMPLTNSIFHRLEGDHDPVRMIKDLHMNITYAWVKGHADDLNREMNLEERLNVIADEQCDLV